MKLFVLATIVGVVVNGVLKLICVALGIPDYWTGYFCGLAVMAVSGYILSKNNRHKAKCFDSYTQYQEWRSKAQKRGDIEIVAVTDFNGHLIVTYIIEE